MLKRTLLLLPLFLFASLCAEDTDSEKTISKIGKYQICALAGVSHYSHTVLLLDTETGKIWKRDHAPGGYWEWEEVSSPQFDQDLQSRK